MYVHPILKVTKNDISIFLNSLKKCMYVDIMFILICADFGEKRPYMTYTKM
jgi:hypothetical protein